MIKSVGKPRREIGTIVIDVDLVKEEGNNRVDNHIAMELPFFRIRNFVRLLVDWVAFIEIQVVYIQDFKEPVTSVPLLSVPRAPCGIHRVFVAWKHCHLGEQEDDQ